MTWSGRFRLCAFAILSTAHGMAMAGEGNEDFEIILGVTTQATARAEFLFGLTPTHYLEVAPEVLGGTRNAPIAAKRDWSIPEGIHLAAEDVFVEPSSVWWKRVNTTTRGYGLEVIVKATFTLDDSVGPGSYRAELSWQALRDAVAKHGQPSFPSRIGSLSPATGLVFNIKVMTPAQAKSLQTRRDISRFLVNQFKKPLPGIAVIVAVAFAIALPTMRIRAAIRKKREDRVYGPFLNTDLSAFFAPPESDDSAAGPYIRGKLVAVEPETRRLHWFLMEMPESLRAPNPGEVGTVMWIESLAEIVGTYGGGEPAFISKWRITLIDLSRKAAIARIMAAGGPAPSKVSAHATADERTGPPPTDAVKKWLLSLPSYPNRARPQP